MKNLFVKIQHHPFVTIIISNAIGLIFAPICYLLKIKFITLCFDRIGHLCIEPDCFIKEDKLFELVS